MTLREWLTHLWSWLLSFPTWADATHTFVGVAGSGEYYCLICGRKDDDVDDDGKWTIRDMTMDKDDKGE